MTDQTAIYVALIAASAGIVGALVGSWIAARETKRAGAMAHVEAQADRDEARRARLADRVSDPAVEGLHSPAAHANGVRLHTDRVRRRNRHRKRAGCPGGAEGLLRLGDHTDRDAKTCSPLLGGQQRPLTARSVAREPADPFLVEDVEFGRVTERPVGPHDLVERAPRL